jgi:hypothetical protein
MNAGVINVLVVYASLFAVVGTLAVLVWWLCLKVIHFARLRRERRYPPASAGVYATPCGCCGQRLLAAIYQAQCRGDL